MTSGKCALCASIRGEGIRLLASPDVTEFVIFEAKRDVRLGALSLKRVVLKAKKRISPRDYIGAAMRSYKKPEDSRLL